MADNIAITAGAGTTIKTDDVAGVHYQQVKLVDGTLEATAVIAADIGVKANALRVAPASDITDATYIGDIKFGEALPAGTAAIGKLAANSGVDIGDVDILSIAAGTNLIGKVGIDQVTANANEVVVKSITAGDTNIGNVDIVTVPAPLNVTGTGVELGALRVTLASDSTGVLSVDDNGGSLTVDGTVDTELTTADLDTGAGTDTRAVVGLVGSASGGGQIIPGSGTDGLLVNLGTNNDISGTVTANLAAGVNNIGDVDVLSIAAGDNNIGNVDVATVPAPLNVTGGGVELGALRVTIANDSTGLLSIDDNAGSLTVDNAALAVTGGGVEATALRVTLASDSTGLVSVDDNAGSLTVDNAALSVVGSGVEATALRVTIASDSTGVLSVDDNGGALTVDGTITASNAAGDVAHDGADSGNPVKVGGKAYNMDGSAPGTAVAEGDRANFITDTYGRQLVDTSHPNFWSVSANYAVAQTNTELKAAPGAGLSLYITDVVCSNGATAGNMKFVEATGAAVDKIEVMYFAINGGAALHFVTPIKLTANVNLGITSVTSTTHSVTVNGYTAS